MNKNDDGVVFLDFMESIVKVSVCIPSYNSARYIGATIQSVLDSTYANLEIIVSDNASTDGTQEIVEAFDDTRVHFYQNESNLGPIENWNRALKKARGEYISLLYSDDLYDPFWLEWAVRILEKHPDIGWVATAYFVINDKNEKIGWVSNLPETREYTLSEAFLCVAKLDGLGPGFVTRQNILKDIGYYDVRAGLSADNDLFLRLASRYTLYYSNYPHTLYRIHTDNLTHSWGIVQQTIEGFKNLGNIFNDETLPEAIRNHRDLVYVHFYHKVLGKIMELRKINENKIAEKLIQLLYTNGCEDSLIHEIESRNRQ